MECEIFAMLANMISFVGTVLVGFIGNGGISNTCEVKKGRRVLATAFVWILISIGFVINPAKEYYFYQSLEKSTHITHQWVLFSCVETNINNEAVVY